jgi:hypothetical protein
MTPPYFWLGRDAENDQAVVDAYATPEPIVVVEIPDHEE